MENNQIEYAKNLIEKAKKFAEKAEEESKKYYPSFSNIITLSQQAIEWSTKAIFKIMEIDFPKDHEIKFETKETEELLKKDFPKSFYARDKIPRLIFLTQFWEKFYEVAKYGKEKLNIPPDKLFDKEEAEIAIKHAKECTQIAEKLEIDKRMDKL